MSHEPEVETVGLLGAGTVGGGWAAAHLARRHRVLVVDPAPAAPQRLRAFLTSAWPTVSRAVPGAPAAPPVELLRVVDADELGPVTMVHEQVPESLEAKHEAYSAAEAAVGPGVPILSSSGGLGPTELAAGMKHPERLVVAHPQNPVYALRLVEVLVGERTDPAVVDVAMRRLEALDKRPVLLRRAVPGHLVNRLTFALLREAVHLVREGVVDARGVEDAVVHGITPRFLQAGPVTSLALAGGPEGMRGAMASFADTIEEWWGDLGEPHLDDDTRALLVAAADDLLDGRTVEQARAERDAAAVEHLGASRDLGTRR